MSGLKWTSYNYSGTLYPYANLISYFNGSNTPAYTGVLTELQISSNVNETPAITTFNGTDNHVAVQFSGFFCPPHTGDYTFYLGYQTSPCDDIGVLFLGNPGDQINPSASFSSTSPVPSATVPIVYNQFNITQINSATMTLYAGNSYPILIDYYQGNYGYTIGFAFSFNGGNHITNLRGYVFTSPTIPCFKEDTKILTDTGYKPIQNLRRGDMIKTLQDNYVAIDMIGKRDIYHHASNERIKNQLYVCNNSNYPEVFEDLVITGCHSILVDSFVSPEQKAETNQINGNIYVTGNKYRLPACVDERTTVYDIPGNYTIYHLALDGSTEYMNFGIYANGLLVETCSKRYLRTLSNMELIE